MDRILIVEDDGHINELLYEALTKEGYDCEQAFSGTEAERLFQENEYALVMLDLMLPGMPGEKVLSSLRKNKKTPVCGPVSFFLWFISRWPAAWPSRPGSGWQRG